MEGPLLKVISFNPSCSSPSSRQSLPVKSQFEPRHPNCHFLVTGIKNCLGKFSIWTRAKGKATWIRITEFKKLGAESFMSWFECRVHVFSQPVWVWFSVFFFWRCSISVTRNYQGSLAIFDPLLWILYFLKSPYFWIALLFERKFSHLWNEVFKV